MSAAQNRYQPLRAVVVFALLLAGASFGAARYWVGGGGNWSDAATHWATTSGGAPGAGNLPTAADAVTIDGGSGGGTLTVNQIVSITSLVVNGGTTLLNLGAYSFTTTGSFDVYSSYGHLGGSDTLHCSGFTDNNGGFNLQTKTIEIIGTSGNIRVGTSCQLYDVIWNRTGSGVIYNDPTTAVGRVNIGRNFVVKQGTVSVGNSASDADTLSIAGDLIVTGGNLTLTSNQVLVGANCTIADAGTNITRGTSTLVMTGTGTLNETAGQSFNGIYNLSVAASGKTTTFGANGPPRVWGTLAVGTGTLNMNNSTMYLHGAGTVMTSAGGTISGGGTFIYEEHSGGPINVAGANYGSSRVWLWASAIAFNLLGNATTTGAFDVSGRGATPLTFNANNFSISAGSMNISDSAIANFGSSTVTTTGDFNFSARTLNLQTSTLNVGGNFAVGTGAIQPAIAAGTSRVVFNGTSGTHDVTLVGQSLYNVDVNGNGAKYRLVDSLQCAVLTISGDTLNTSAGTARNIRCSSLNITGGSLTANSSTITINGNCSIAAAAGLFTCGTSTVVLAATGNVSSPANFANRFCNLTQNGGIVTTLTGNVMVYGLLTCGSGSTIRADGSNRELRISDATPIVNTVTWGGGAGKLLLDFWGNTGYAADNYGDCDLRFTNWAGTPAFAGDITTTGDVSTGTDYSDGRQATVDLNGHNLTCRNLTLGEASSTNRGGRMYLTNSASVLRVSGNLTINADNGTYANAVAVPASGTNSIFVGGNWTIGSGGAFDAQGSSVTLNGASGTQTITSNGASFAKVNINCPGATVALADSLSATDSVAVRAGSLNLNTGNLRTGGVFLVSNGTAGTLQGLAGRTITAGRASLNGTAGNLLNLNPASTWYINAGASLAADYATLMNSNASGGATGNASVNCTNAGANVNWNFGGLASPGPLSYTLNPAVYTVGAVIATNTCTNGGGAATSFAISPAMSAGLLFNTASGNITGTPTASAALQVYKVKATNASGSDSVNLTITVNPQPPVLSFVNDTLICTVGTAILRDSVVNSGGAVAGNFSINPSLTTQTGLSFSTATGAVSGIPTTASALAAYVVSAVNAGGGGLATVYIRVKRAAPGTLAYVASSLVCTSGVAVRVDSLRVTGGGAIDSFTVNPPLPAGIGLNPANGAVSGTPTDTSKAAAAYTVTAWNESGTPSVALSVQVKRAPPGPLSYASSRPTYTRDNAITPNVLANLGGRVDAYTITPPLPANLALDALSGAISGTPTVALAQTVFKVKGTNESGADSTYDTITVSLSVTVPVIGYSPASVVDTVGIAALHAMSNSGSQADSVTISPDSLTLAAVGLHFDRLSGLVNGTPTDTLTATLFTLIAHNAAGRDTATLRLQVVGRPVAANPITLQARALGYSQIELSWNYIGASGADSVRISYDTLPIPLGAQQVSAPWVRHYGVGPTVDTISGLSQRTLYYFAAQARIDSQWTTVSLAASASDTTLELDTNLFVLNSIVVTNAYYDSTLNRLVVSWRFSFKNGVQYGYTFGVDSSATAQALPSSWVDARDSVVTTYISMDESVLFDTTFYVCLRLKKASAPPGGGYESPTTPQSTAKVRVPLTLNSWQPITYFKQATGDTVWAFNRNVAFWYQGVWIVGPTPDTLNIFRPVPPLAGFVPVSTGWTARLSLDGPAITMAMRYDSISIPAGYTAADVRMYRRTIDGRWMIIRGQTLQSTLGMVSVKSRFWPGESLILMVDTTAPTVTVLTNLDSILTAGTLATLAAKVSDNCANLTITFGFARAEQVVGRPWHNSDTLAIDSAQFLDTVPGAFVTENGVRSYLIVSDGLHSDTINVSRRVRCAFASDVSTEAGVWVPVRTTAKLDDSSFAPVLQALLGQSAYDPYRCRLFRWYEPAALPTDINHWVEYSSATDSLFNLLPSRLSWVKAAQTTLLNFGSGVTLSLRDTFTLNLLPNDWTDFALPYGFSINIGDILDATGSAADSLQFYAWTRSANSYTTLPLYIASLPDSSSHVRTRALSAAARDGYSVYNPSLASRTLRIPPVCVPMSTVIAKRLAKSTAADAWALRLEATRPDHSPITTLLCGYQRDLGDRTYYPPSPSFATLALRVRDSDHGAMHGHAIDHAADRFGGFAYDLVLSNSASVPQSVVLNISGMARLADSMDVRLVETSSGAVLTPQGVPLSFTIPAQGSLSRTLAVGGSGYYRHLIAHVKPFAQFAAFPNPFHGLLSVQFLMPEGVARVDCRLFDLKGRTAWFYSQTHITPEAINKIVWNSRDSQSPLAAGRFILKLQAFDTNGKLLKSLNQNLINLP